MLLGGVSPIKGPVQFLAPFYDREQYFFCEACIYFCKGRVYRNTGSADLL